MHVRYSIDPNLTCTYGYIQHQKIPLNIHAKIEFLHLKVSWCLMQPLSKFDISHSTPLKQYIKFYMKNAHFDHRTLSHKNHLGMPTVHNNGFQTYLTGSLLSRKNISAPWKLPFFKF